jgi:putative ABC transport system ATP-binding protein
VYTSDGPTRDGRASADANAEPTDDAAADPAIAAHGDPDATRAGDDDGDADPVVAVRDVRKTYDLGGTVEALAGVSLRLPAGSYTAVMGPSGSGKSTLLNLVGALDTPTSGTVEVAGRDVGAVDEADRAALRGTEIGFVFQTFNLMPRLDAVENVALPLVFAGWDRDRRRERARDLLDRVGLGERYDHRPTELSGGQRQRVAIARALAPDPAVILADEPTGNVDTGTGAGIMRLLADVNDRGTTVLLVSHSRRIAGHADRIVHLRDGLVESIESIESGDGSAGDAAADTSGATSDDPTRGTAAGESDEPAAGGGDA